MKRYEREQWTDACDSPGATFEDAELLRCKLDGGSFGSRAKKPSQRTIVRRVHAQDCTVTLGLRAVGIQFEDVQVFGLRTPRALWLGAPLFKHVVLSGRMGTIIIQSERSRLNDADDRKMNAAFAASARDFYSTVDWALDISKAEFTELDWRADVPARLVRRDPATQFVVTRERILDGRWRKVPLHEGCAIALDMFSSMSTFPDTILVAPKRHKEFALQLESLELLRREGIAEPE